MAQQITVARPVPQRPRRHSPWTGRFLLGLALLVVATVLASAIFSVVANFSSSVPQPIVAQQPEVDVPAVVPAAPAVVDVQVQIEPVPVVPTTPEVRLNWTYVGSGVDLKKGVVRLPTEGKAFFISWDEVQAELKFTESSANGGWSGMGDGTAFFLTNWHGEYRFTPDRGEHWFKPANLDPGKSISPPQVPMAILEDRVLVLSIQLEPEPNKTVYWVAEIPLAELEELSP